MVNVVGSHCGSGKFHDDVVFLIGHLGRGQKADAVTAVGLFDLFESGGSIVQGFIPTGLGEGAVLANQGFGQSLRVLDKLMNVPTLDAQFALIDGVGLGGNSGDCLTVQYLQIEPTATTTVSTRG